MKVDFTVTGGILGTPSIQVDDQNRLVLEAELARLWAEVHTVPVVGLHDDFFFHLGGGEERALLLSARIEQALKVSITLADIREASTISKMADLVQIRKSAGEKYCIVPIRPGGTKKPLFVLHGIGGNVLGFAELARSLDPEQPVYGIQAQSLTSGGPTLVQLEAMAEFYVNQVKSVQPSGPYSFLGLCFGGLVAYEMAQQLVANGETVQFLGLLDTRQPGFEKEILNARTLPKLAWMRLRQIRRHTRRLSLRQWPPYVQTRLKSRLLRLMYRRINTTTATVSLPDSLRRTKDINLTAALRYKVQPYPGRVTLFRAEEDVSYLPEDFSWRRYARAGVEIVRLPGDHGQMLAEPSLSAMAASIERGLIQHETAIHLTTSARDEFEIDIEGPVHASDDHVRADQHNAIRAEHPTAFATKQKAG